MADKLIKLEGVSKYYGRHRILSGIDLEIHRDDILGLVGPNGSGKSTLLKMLPGLVFNSAGLVSSLAGGGRPIAALLDKPGFFPGFSLEKNLVLFCGCKKPETFNRIVERLGLTTHLHKKFRHCSTGVQKRCELASALLQQPGMLLLDEPISGLDPAGVYVLRSVIRELHERRCPVMIADHALKELETICNKICFLRRGMIQATLSTRDLLSKFENLEEAYRFYNLAIK